MKINSAKDFFYKYIKLVSSMLNEEYKLTYKESMFLLECCLYHYNGGDLNNMKELSNHMMEIKFFKRKTDVSLYKYKLSLKQWAKTSRDVFQLPPHLLKRKGDKLNYSITLEYEENISN